MPLRNPFRHSAEAPTIRDRAADLSARLATAMRKPEPEASAASPEAGDPVVSDACAPADLAAACDQAVIDWNAIQPRSRSENWGDDRLDEALYAYGTAFKRAIHEPSRTLPETQAKARLLLHDLREHQGNDEGQETDDQRLVRVVLREVAGLTDAAPLSASSLNLASLVDLSAATMSELQAIYDMTNEVSTMAHAFVSSGRGMAEGGRGGLHERLTPAGNLMLWVTDL